MAYSTLAALCKQFGYREISQLLCDEAGVLTEAMLVEAVAGDDLTLYSADEQSAIYEAVERAADALDRQSAFMDSLISVRYELPLLPAAIDASPLAECCLALTRAYLADDIDNSSDVIEKARDRWTKWLRDLAKDHATIPRAERVTVGGSEQNYHTTKITGGVDFSAY